MKFRPRNSSQNGSAIVEMNTTPLIDVLLVLLVMLIVTIPIQTHAVKLDNPVTPSEPNQAPIVAIEVDFDGSVTWNGAPVPDRAALGNYLRLATAQYPQPEVHLRANRLARYGDVAVVLADVQRNGLRHVGFAGGEQYME
jgi:biopolymer transport protein ExbD